MSLLYPSTPDEEITRDRPWGRPVIGGVPHTRVSTIAKVLDDQGNLINWAAKVAMLGCARRPDIARAAFAHRDDDKALRELAEQAKEAGGAGAAAMTGTALHALTEQLDRAISDGQRPDEFIAGIPSDADRADLTAYYGATLAFDVLGAELFCVDSVRCVAGTADRLLRVGGRSFLADLKTSSSSGQYLLGPTAIQLRAYANGMPYGAPDWPDDFDPDIGLLIHLPQGSGRCELTWLDLDAAERGLELALQVRSWRAGHKKFIAMPAMA